MRPVAALAITHGIDGTALAGAIAVIAGLGGFVAARATAATNGKTGA